MLDFFEWRPSKEDASTHGVAFASVAGFDWDTAIEARDTRKAYDEVRTVAVGLVGDRLHVLVFTRRAEKVRIISFRKANRREIAHYVAFTEHMG
ncbi:BrnT family toxin [Xanthobacter agilis]|uniref:BrnT family toxin n=1 Tax=Xanthobacter agilis TaxID=47492 RepID=UPI003727D923